MWRAGNRTVRCPANTWYCTEEYTVYHKRKTLVKEECGDYNGRMPNIFTFIIQNVSLGVGLAMDAFSVSVTDGLKEHDMRRSRAFFIAGIYGGFQFLLPLIGWGCVQRLEQLFASFQRFIPWIALGLLLFLGLKMIRESLRREEEADASAAARKSTGTLLLQGVATSIDALSVGFTIADYSLRAALAATLLIGAVTFAICLIGLRLGRLFGTRLLRRAGILGGLILIAIGLEIFLTHVL